MREFDHSSLWGNIGGYIGMILGISLLQLPFILANTYGFLRNKLIKETASKQWNGQKSVYTGPNKRKQSSCVSIGSGRQRL